MSPQENFWYVIKGGPLIPKTIDIGINYVKSEIKIKVREIYLESEVLVLKAKLNANKYN